MRALRRPVLLAVALAVIAAASATPAAARTKPLPALAPAPRDSLTRALEAGRLTAAAYALERARSLFRPAEVRAEFGATAEPGPRDATLLLRDLALRLRFLARAERAEAERILARPDEGGVPIGNGWSEDEAPGSPLCDPNVCIHWVASGPDRPRPDGFEGTVFSTLQEVWNAEIGSLGYRPPRDDSASDNDGGGPELDVYLDNVGSDGVFGYCTSDDPRRFDPTVFAVSAYCVLDNDYAAVQFGTSETPEDFLRVTAAHEFNHASQFAYDWLEDAWLLEGTATNMEETVYPDVDDNVNFLRASQLRHPAWPLDRGGFGDTEYGSWIFWRYLQEKAYGGDASVIRRVWERADASTPFALDEYSLQATRRALAADGKSLPDEYAAFAVANRLRDYLDGALYPVPQASEVVRLGPGRRSTGWRDWRLNHLTTRFVSLRPGPYGSKTAKLEVHVALSRYGARATLVSRYGNGSVEVRPIALGPRFGGGVRVPFGRGAVTRVDLVLTNGSSRMRACFTHFDPPSYSCAGVPQDDGQVASYRATLR